MLAWVSLIATLLLGCSTCNVAVSCDGPATIKTVSTEKTNQIERTRQ